MKVYIVRQPIYVHEDFIVGVYLSRAKAELAVKEWSHDDDDYYEILEMEVQT